MNRLLLSKSSSIIFAMITFLLMVYACRKSNEPAVEDKKPELQKVSFSFDNFQTEIKPFDFRISTKSSGNTFQPHPESSELLYFLSFDKRNYTPDYSQKDQFTFRTKTKAGGAEILVPVNTGSENTVDWRLQLKDVENIRIQIPARNLSQIDRLEFDFGSNEPHIDGLVAEYFYVFSSPQADGQEIFMLSPESIRESKMETFRFNIPKGRLTNQEFQILLSFNKKEVLKDRTLQNKDWSLWVDNFRIYGKPKTQVQPKIIQLPYFIFNKTSGELMDNGNFIPSAQNRDLLLELPTGSYYNVMVYNEGDQELMVPNNLKHKDQLQLTSSFNNRNSRIFATVDSFELKESMEKKVILKRLYSLITLDFTDIRNLSNLKSIKVKPLVEPYFWSPFFPALPAKTTESVANEIIFEQDFNLNREISFSHFLGFPEQEVPVSYEIEVFEEERMIRRFRLNTKLKNNVRLAFSGPIYPTGVANQYFEVEIDETWTDDKRIEFK